MSQDQQRSIPQNVDQFVRQVVAKLNRHRLWNILLWTIMIGGLCMVVVALAYIIPGYAVPKIWYVVIFGGAFIAALACWLVGRVTQSQAASFADKFYDLKDSVWSCVKFAAQNKSGSFYDLQADQADESVQKMEVESIKYRFPYQVAFFALLLVLISVAAGFRPTAPHILEKQQQEQQTFQLTADANEELRQLIDELEASIDDEEEQELVEPDKLRQWVDQLTETTDRKQAMRQYAKLELKLNRAAEALRQRNDEKMLDAAAIELKKDADSKELGKKLAQKQYKDAAEDLKKMKPEDFDPKKLSEQKKEIARLKAMANRMADAARNTQQNESGRQSKLNSQNANSQHGASSDSQPSDEEMSELGKTIEELEEALEELDENMELADFSDLDLSEMDDEQREELEECEACQEDVGRKLDELGDKLMKLARKRAASQKLKALSQQCAQCQAQALAMSRQKGGKKPGTGSVDSMREDVEEQRVDNEQYTRLRGIKGNGRSMTKVEEARDGTGVSRRQHAAKQRDFKRQFESFVGREDIPEDLKDGVRNYFLDIHKDENESGSESTTTPDDEP